MIYLKQSTASQEVPLGYFVDSVDGDTEKTALTIANTDIKLWKTGATTLANKNSGGATHISNGIYYAVLDATDTDTLGPIRIHVHVAGARPVVLECVVLAANVYDSLIGATDNLQIDVTQCGGSAVAAGAIPNAAAAANGGLPTVDASNAVKVQSGTGANQISLTSGAVILTAAERNSTADAILARALAAESYAADGAVPTLSQILYMLWSAIAEFSIASTTITCKKLDGLTTSMSFTLNSATAPTSRTRAS